VAWNVIFDRVCDSEIGEIAMKTARDIMTTDVIAVRKDTSLKELAKLLYERHINGAPVVDESGALIGVICESDLIRKNKKLHIPTVVTFLDAVFYLESSKTFEKEVERISATTVGDLYQPKVLTVIPETPIEEIASLMSQKKAYTLPVVEGDRLVGVIGKGDLIRTLSLD
jgi:CBS domain-containing protein